MRKQPDLSISKVELQLGQVTSLELYRSRISWTP